MAAPTMFRPSSMQRMGPLHGDFPLLTNDTAESRRCRRHLATRRKELKRKVCRSPRRGHRAELYEHLLGAIAVHRVADRPDRFEPRMAKRRPKRYDRLTRPRREIKLRMLKRFSKI